MIRFVWVALFAFSTLGGCGGDDDGDGDVSCTTFSACGGALEGDWKLEKWCDVELGFDECPGAELLSFPQPSGMVSFKSDGTYSSTFTVGPGTVRMKFPLSCFMGVTSCDQLNQSGELTCTGNATDGCTCEQMVSAMTETETGTYMTSGNTITLTSSEAGSTPTTVEYCVSGSTLRVREMGEAMVMVFSK